MRVRERDVLSLGLDMNNRRARSWNGMISRLCSNERKNMHR